jgi:thiamine-monophosphate kinase
VLPASLLFSGATGFFLTSTDTVVENVHFRPSTTDAQALGEKALAAALSDLAACGATPRGCLVSAQLPATLHVEWVEEFFRGLTSLAQKEQCPLVGGDTVRGEEIAFCVTVFGVTERAPLLRSGASAGDDVWLSGTIGESGLGLLLLERGDKEPHSLIERHRRPTPRLALGQALLNLGATSCIDITDGLLQDCRHIAEESGKTVMIDLPAVPVPEIPLTLSGLPPLFPLTAGEDYELCFTAPPALRPQVESAGHRLGVKLTRIGRVEQGGAKVTLLDGETEVIPDQYGFNHFFPPVSE